MQTEITIIVLIIKMVLNFTTVYVSEKLKLIYKFITVNIMPKFNTLT